MKTTTLFTTLSIMLTLMLHSAAFAQTVTVNTSDIGAGVRYILPEKADLLINNSNIESTDTTSIIVTKGTATVNNNAAGAIDAKLSGIFVDETGSLTLNNYGILKSKWQTGDGGNLYYLYGTFWSQGSAPVFSFSPNTTINNAAGATVEGDFWTLWLRAAGIVSNSGLIRSNKGAGVLVHDVGADPLLLFNNNTGKIEGARYGILTWTRPCTDGITNYGQIMGTDYDALGIQTTTPALITNEAGATISGGFAAIEVSGGSSGIFNSGTIKGWGLNPNFPTSKNTGKGILIAETPGNTINNFPTGIIEGQRHGILLEVGGNTINNDGAIYGGDGGDGNEEYGIYSVGSRYKNNRNIINNFAEGKITGDSIGIYFRPPYTVINSQNTYYKPGGVVNNSGTICGMKKHGIFVDGNQVLLPGDTMEINNLTGGVIKTNSTSSSSAAIYLGENMECVIKNAGEIRGSHNSGDHRAIYTRSKTEINNLAGGLIYTYGNGFAVEFVGISAGDVAGSVLNNWGSIIAETYRAVGFPYRSNIEINNHEGGLISGDFSTIAFSSAGNGFQGYYSLKKRRYTQS